tara:strand:- start:276 stop:749 length:474 start_codon:yes stop_codon:yes gene_type:complete
MKQRLSLVVKMQEETEEKDIKNQKSSKKKYQAASTKPKQTFNEYCVYLRRKNIMETQVFKKKFEAVHRHISGMPKPAQENDSYQPSIFSEQLSDPKMNIPQNKELFNNVIKYEEKDTGDGEQLGKPLSVEEEIENEIEAIKKRLSKKFEVVDDVNHA